MKSLRVITVVVALAMFMATTASAQEKAPEKVKAKEELLAGTPLKIQVVFSEYDGEKKVSSMPYSLSVWSDERSPERWRGSLRVGLKMPIFTAGKDSQIQYMDVGTDMDCFVQRQDEGRFKVNFQVRRTSVNALEAAAKESATADIGGRPILRNFSAQGDLVLRDGQTALATTAADPLSGRILRVEITLNVVK